MNLAILFWFYKEPEICENRLKILKKYNPDLKIYGLYGGDHKEAPAYKNRLRKCLDDFYICPSEDPKWKWIHGDLALLDWYEQKGCNLEWDSIVIVQWDMLVFTSLKDEFRDMKKGEVFFSGLRTLDAFIEKNWAWTSRAKDRKNYLSFLGQIKKDHGYTEKPLCCLFILEVFPKKFFAEYSKIPNKELGMLEYKTPLYAKIFDVPFYKKDVGILWFEDVPKPLNARAMGLKQSYIKKELRRPEGWRIFHPYFKIWEDN